MYILAEFESKKQVTPADFVFTGPGSPWEVVMDLAEIKAKINPEYFKKAPPYASKYLPLLPIKDYSAFVSLGEGATPLIKSTVIAKELAAELYFKLESHNPTGSFKDRGSAVELTIAKELGAKGITVASTGNMAASCSCYAAAAHIPCFVFVPEDTPPSKLAQVIAYGGRIVQVKGSYSDAAGLAQAVARKLNFYLAGDYAFRVEGHKTAAFELADQLFFQLPDLVVVPMGCGTNIAAYYKGFHEYAEIGFIDRIPQLIGVQAEGAPTIVSAFKKQLRKPIPVERAQSIAGAIAINNPIDGIKALDALYSTQGRGFAVSDQEMLEAQYRLSKDEGLFVETSCAATVAALFKLAQERSLAHKKIVCIMTGGGLKDPGPILKIAIKPPLIYPEVGDFLSLYNNSFFEGRNVTFVTRDAVVFTKAPSKDEIRKQVHQLFHVTYSDEYLERIREITARFLKKGKPITFSDFQDIVQDALETLQDKPKKIFAVANFEVKTALNEKAHAVVSVLVGGEKKQAAADGVGPVDAVINALKTACGDLSFSLAGYKVDIRSEGTDAVVYVELKLVKDNKVSVGTGASPDIIQASIEAFEDAYNGFG